MQDRNYEVIVSCNNSRDLDYSKIERIIEKVSGGHISIHREWGDKGHSNSFYVDEATVINVIKELEMFDIFACYLPPDM